jgi:translocation and assembly module TamA
MLPIRHSLSLLLLVSCCVPAVGWARGTIEKITIRGLDKGDDAEMIENIEVSLSVYDVVGKVQGESRLEYLLSQAERQTRQALEPFGYYNPTISVEAPRSGDSVNVVINVAKGAPVTVRRADIAIDGPGGSDRYLQQDLEQFEPLQGEKFDHTSYEASKITVTRRLAERGYFDADFTQRRVEITRAENAADIALGWDSGMRYNIGHIRFHDDYFRPGLFEQLVYWEQGSYWHEGKLDRLRESLNKLDYFSTIDIQPRPEEGWESGEVPVDITLTRAKRTIYTAGVSFGSESGAGVRGGVERRYVNRRGHKLNTQVDYAQKRKSLLTSYRIPAFRWLDGWYAVTATAYDEQTDYIDLRNYKLIGSRSGEVSENLTLVASLNAIRERWRFSSGDGYDGAQYETATLYYPQLVADYVNVDDRLFPRRGYSGSATLRAGMSGAGADASFTQLHLLARAYFPVGQNNRLIARAEAGTTWTGDLVAIPPSLRYFAGGDRSIRGYAFREVGPRTPAPDRYALGAKNVVVASAEYEHYFGSGPWGAAVFVDTGSAYDDKVELKTGVGFGLRWKSPVGPVRVDIAHGLNDPDSQFQLYLNIGADL